MATVTSISQMDTIIVDFGWKTRRQDPATRRNPMVILMKDTSLKISMRGSGSRKSPILAKCIVDTSLVISEWARDTSHFPMDTSTTGCGIKIRPLATE